MPKDELVRRIDNPALMGGVPGLMAALDMSEYTKRAVDELINGQWTLVDPLFTQYLVHAGDLDTFINFQDDSFEVDVGGITALHLDDTIVRLNGNVSLNDAADSKTTLGLTINQGTNDDNILALQSDDVDHGITNNADTNTYGQVFKDEPNFGGLEIQGFKAAGAASGVGGLELVGFRADNADTTKSTAGRGLVQIWGYQASGTGIANTVADGNVLGIGTYRGGAYTNLWILDEDGDTWQDGRATMKTAVRCYSPEAGKTDWRFTINANDADLTHLYNYDEGEAAYQSVQFGGTLTVGVGLTILATGDGLFGTEDGGGKLNFDEGTTIADGIVWGSDENKVTLYRSADDVLKTDDNLIVLAGLAIGDAGALGADRWLDVDGVISGSTCYGLVITPSVGVATTDLWGVYARADTEAAVFTLDIAGAIRAQDPQKGAGSTITTAYGLWVENITSGTTNWSIYTGAAASYLGGDATVIGGLNIGTGTGAAPGDIHTLHTGTDAVIQVEGTYPRLVLLSETDVHYGFIEWRKDTGSTRGAYMGWGTPGTNIQLVLEDGNDFAITGGDVTMGGALTVTGCVADGTCEIFTEDALIIIRETTSLGTGELDKYGHEHLDLEAIHHKYPYLIHEQDGKYYDRLGAKSDLLYRATMQLNDFRLGADAEREAIRAEITGLQETLDKMERRG